MYNKFIGLAIISTGILGISLIQNASLMAILALIAITFVLFVTLFSLRYTFLLMLFIRPSIDIFGSTSVGLGPLSLNAASAVAAYFMVISGLLIFKNSTTNLKNLRAIPLILPISFFLIATFLYTFSGISLSTGINEVIRIISFILPYFAVYSYVNNRQDTKQLITVILTSALIPASVALYQLVNVGGLYTNPGFENRILGTFGHPNVLAYFLFLILALSIYTLTDKHYFVTQERRFLLGSYAVFLAFLLIQTYTRGAWIALVIVLLGYSWIRYRYNTIKYGLIALAIVTIGYIGYLTIGQYIQLPSLESISVFKRLGSLFTSDPSDSVLWRQGIWIDLLNTGLQEPLKGHGTGNIQIVAEETRGIYQGSLEVHNDYIRMIVEMGVIGLLIYIWLLITIIIQLSRKFIQTKKDTLVLVLTLIMTTYCIISLWDNIIRGTALMWCLFALLGAIMKEDSTSRYNNKN